jgi:hypothetical protein
VAVGERVDATPSHLAFAAAYDGSSWTSSTFDLSGLVAGNPNAHVRAVSCGSATSCVAAGDYTNAGHVLGFVATGPSAWSVAALPLPSSGVDPSPDVDVASLSCVATQCAGIGTVTAATGRRVPLLIRMVPGSVTELGVLPATSVAAGSEATEPTSIACRTGTTCVGVGSFKEGVSASAPLVSTLSPTGWTTVRGPVPAGMPDPLSLDAVALDGPVGVAVGGFTSGGLHQALIVMDLPAG